MPVTRAARIAMDRFVLLCQAHGLPRPETEVTFHPTRKWRADYLFRDAKIIVERDGGIFRGGKGGGSALGGHSGVTGIVRDMAKGNAAQLLGYRFLRYTPEQLESGQAIEELKAVLR